MDLIETEQFVDSFNSIKDELQIDFTSSEINISGGYNINRTFKDINEFNQWCSGYFDGKLEPKTNDRIILEKYMTYISEKAGNTYIVDEQTDEPKGFKDDEWKILVEIDSNIPDMPF